MSWTDRHIRTDPLRYVDGCFTMQGKSFNTTASTTSIVIPDLAGYGDDFFNNHYYMTCIKNADSAGAAPEGEYRLITDYESASGTFSVDAFSATVASTDELLVMHELIYLIYIATSAGVGQYQFATTTEDLNQAANTYDLLTGTTQPVLLETLSFKMPNVDISGGALTYITIQTDDTTAQVVFNSTDGALANLTQEAELSFVGAIRINVGTKLQLTIAGGAAGSACVTTITAGYKAITAGGTLA